MLATDSSKLGHTALAHVGPARLVHTLVTDTAAPADQIAALQEAGAHVVTV